MARPAVWSSPPGRVIDRFLETQFGIRVNVNSTTVLSLNWGNTWPTLFGAAHYTETKSKIKIVLFRLPSGCSVMLRGHVRRHRNPDFRFFACDQSLDGSDAIMNLGKIRSRVQEVPVESKVESSQLFTVFSSGAVVSTVIITAL